MTKLSYQNMFKWFDENNMYENIQVFSSQLFCTYIFLAVVVVPHFPQLRKWLNKIFPSGEQFLLSDSAV